MSPKYILKGLDIVIKTANQLFNKELGDAPEGHLVSGIVKQGKSLKAPLTSDIVSNSRLQNCLKYYVNQPITSYCANVCK